MHRGVVRGGGVPAPLDGDRPPRAHRRLRRAPAIPVLLHGRCAEGRGGGGVTALAPTGHRVCGVAREQGPVRALAALYDGTGVDVLHCGPGGHALAPLAVAHDATRLCLAGTVVDRDTAAEKGLTPSALDRLDLISIRAHTTLRAPPRTCPGR